MPPHFVHSLVGNKVWEGYWLTRSTGITEANWVPASMLPILKFIVESKAAELALLTENQEKAVARMKAALEGAAQRRKRGFPY